MTSSASMTFEELKIAADGDGLTPGYCSGEIEIEYDRWGDWWITSVSLESYYDEEGERAPHDLSDSFDRKHPIGKRIIAIMTADRDWQDRIIEAVVEAAADEWPEAHRNMTRSDYEEHGTW
jgi:hypothetical protein